jgi:putative glutamine amidotransferase
LLRQFVRQCDGLLLTGGQDVAPALYGEEIQPRCGSICALRDQMEATLFAAAAEADKPILGICRGLQFLNAHLGGSLYQDIPSELDSTLTHAQAPPYDQSAHAVDIEPDSPLFTLLGKPRIAVNSCHHQGIKRLAPELSVMARAEDGLVEAVWMPARRWVWAVQWHPECSLEDPASQALFAHFVRACSAVGSG